jgi:hypothetical protein
LETESVEKSRLQSEVETITQKLKDEQVFQKAPYFKEYIVLKFLFIEFKETNHFDTG